MTLGRQNSNEFGAQQIPALEISYLLMASGHAWYTDDPNVRVRRNVFIVSPKGTGKTRLIEKIFPLELCDGLPLGTDADTYFDDRVDGHKAARMRIALLTNDTTKERIRGGLSPAGTPIPPIATSCDLLVIGEFTEFMGSRQDAIQDKGYWLNRMAEEGTIENSLVKYYDIDDEKILAVAAACRRAGMSFNIKSRTLSYNASVTIWAATHPLDPKLAKYLMDIGLMSRFAEVVTPGNESHIRAAVADGFFGKMDKALVRKVLSLNKLAWRTTFKTLNHPPKWATSEVLKVYLNAYDSIHRDTGVTYTEMLNGRIMGDIAQLITAACIARTLSAIDAGKNPTPVIESLDYQPVDVAVARKLASRIVARLYSQHQDRTETDPMIPVASAELVSMCKLIKTDEELLCIPRKVFEVLHKQVCSTSSPSTVTRRITVLRKAGLLGGVPGRIGCHAPSDEFLVANGIAPEHVAKRYYNRNLDIEDGIVVDDDEPLTIDEPEEREEEEAKPEPLVAISNILGEPEEKEPPYVKEARRRGLLDD